MTEPTIQQALAAVMADVDHVAKRDRNSAQNFNFRGIDATVNAVGPALRKHKVIVTPNVRSYEYGSVEVGQKRTPMGHARLVVEYTFHGPDGSSIVASAPGEAFDSGDKATPKAMSVAFRTALLQALALPTDEPDPDSQAYERAPAPSEAEKIAAAQQYIQDFTRRVGEANDKMDLAKLQAEGKRRMQGGVITPDDARALVELLNERAAQIEADK